MKRGYGFFAVGVLITVVIAVAVSQLASSQPDGLEYVAAQEGFAAAAEDHALADSPLADYGGESRTTLALAGLVGVLVTLGLGYAIFSVVKAGKKPSPR